jgi:hypothetical protein
MKKRSWVERFLNSNDLLYSWIDYTVTASKNIETALLVAGQLRLVLVDLQHSQHNLINEYVDLLVRTDQVNVDFLSHRF